MAGLFMIVSCKKDTTNNNNNTVVTPKGNLQVFVHKDIASGVCFANAEVKLYVSDSARTAGIDTLTANTDPVNPTAVGAMFFNLPFRKAGYFLKAHYVNQGDVYEGTGSVVVPTNTTRSFHITVIKQ